MLWKTLNRSTFQFRAPLMATKLKNKKRTLSCNNDNVRGCVPWNEAEGSTERKVRFSPLGKITAMRFRAQSRIPPWGLHSTFCSYLLWSYRAYPYMTESKSTLGLWPQAVKAAVGSQASHSQVRADFCSAHFSRVSCLASWRTATSATLFYQPAFP